MRWECGLVSLGWLASVSCASPATLPLFVEDDLSFSLDAASSTGSFAADPDSARVGAVVYVFNRTRSTGIIVLASTDGSVRDTASFPMQAGDEVVVAFENDSVCTSLCVVLHQGAVSAGDACRNQNSPLDSGLCSSN